MNNPRTHIILTHPLWGNYGGMLQAYSVRLIVSELVGTTVVGCYKPKRPNLSLFGHIWKWKKACTDIVALALLERGLAPSGMLIPDFLKNGYISAFKRLLPTCEQQEALFHSVPGCTHTTWVVGSDQVWRAVYGRALRSVPFFFLDFLPEEARRRSISYAASFGTDEWEGTPEETEKCRKLLQQFKAVSVREHSGVKICRDTFGVDAVQMPDPTLLVRQGDYQHIIDSEKTYQRKGPYIAAYVLDESPEPLEALRVVAEDLGLPVQHLMPHANAKLLRDRFPISVPQWLRYMKECEFVVTDSFHGCVFAIIFNKPFVCLGNEGRGSARFDTLFQTFHLESRLATSAEQAVAVAQEPIDWDAVNAIHEAERMRGLAFLRENLT